MTGEILTVGRGATAAAVSDDRADGEITPDGYLRLPGPFCAEHFPQDRCAGLMSGQDYVLMPATIYAQNGIIMKQRNLAGERSALIREVWGDDHPVGRVEAVWQGKRRRLVVRPSAASDSATGGSGR